VKLAWLLLAVLSPSMAAAESIFLGPLLDNLGTPESPAEDLLKALENAGFVVDEAETLGPEGLKGDQPDPYYYQLTAKLSPASAIGQNGLPLINLICSRIGHPTRDALVDGAFVAALQTWTTVSDFEAGALAQLKCRIDLLPGEGTVLPSVNEVEAVITARFAKVWIQIGTEEKPMTNLGWVLYPPLDDLERTELVLPLGQTLIGGRNAAMSGMGKPDWIVYDHVQTDFKHSFVVTSHIPLFGS
jgi:hypothetical protein